jgi:16S rRNA (adenine1518-N6/adenine1519-N6)-dimethyltransferase
MTQLLAERSRKVIAIELDRELAAGLQERFREKPGVQIIQADVLDVDLVRLCAQEEVPQAFVFGNLPYYITSPILHHLFERRQAIRSMGLLMQREVAERLIACPETRDYGYLTVATQLFSEPRIALAIPPGAFSPPPKVQSSLVVFRMQLKFKQWSCESHQKFLAFVKTCFARKRKTLQNNLSGTFQRAIVLETLEIVSKPLQSRAEELSIEELAQLFECLTTGRSGRT